MRALLGPRRRRQWRCISWWKSCSHWRRVESAVPAAQGARHRRLKSPPRTPSRTQSRNLSSPQPDCSSPSVLQCFGRFIRCIPSAVTYVAGRADPLAALFGFSGLAAGLASLTNPRARSWPRMLGAAAVCFLLAMLSKESGLIFLPLWLLILAWRRAHPGGSSACMDRHRALVCRRCILLRAAFHRGRKIAAAEAAPPGRRRQCGLRPLRRAPVAEYAALLVAPVNLHMERDVATHPKKDISGRHSAARARMREYQTLAGQVLLLIGFAGWFRWKRA